MTGQRMMGHHRWWLAASLFNILFLYAPIAVLVVFSFNAGRLSAVWQGFSLEWYRVLALDRSLLDALENSLIVATTSSFAATGLGLSAAIGLERLPSSRQRLLDGLLLIPLVIPEIMLGMALLLLFVMVALPLSLATVAIGHIVFNVPVALVIVKARLRRLDPHLEEAARDLGATSWQAFRHVTLPLLMPAVLGAWLMAFTVSLDDFIVTFFTAGPGATTLPLKVYSMIKSGVSPEINALSTLLVLASMALVGLSLLLQRERSTT